MNLLVKVVLLLSTLVFELHPCESQNITVYSDYDYEGNHELIFMLKKSSDDFSIINYEGTAEVNRD